MARGVTQAGFARSRSWQPTASTGAILNWLHFLANGQSLSTGVDGTPQSFTQIGDNRKLRDPTDTYALNNPTAGTLTAAPLIAPQKDLLGGGAYPFNSDGEGPEIAMANAVYLWARKLGYRKYRVCASSTGMLGQPMSSVKKGGTQNPYAAGQYEQLAFAHLLGAGQLACIPFTHGETDANQQSTTYQPDLVTLIQNYNADAASNALIQGTYIAPMIASQQSSSPGAFNGFNVTAAALLAAHIANPGLVLCMGPKYNLPYVGDATHLNAAYPRLGEKMAEVFVIAKLLGYTWNPLYVKSVSRVGTTLTLTMQMPPGLSGRPNWPLVFDSSVAAPHGVGTVFSMWAGGQGIEIWDQQTTVTACTGNGVAIVLTVSVPPPTTAGTCAITGVLGNTNANGVWNYTSSGNQVTLTGPVGGGSAPVGNGAYTSGGVFVVPIGVTSASISTFRPDQVTVQIARTPIGQSAVGIAEWSDQPYSASIGTGGFGNRSSCIRDTNLLIGPVTGGAMHNWACEQTVAFS